MGDLDLAHERFLVGGEAVVLRGEVDLVADHVAHGMIRAAVSELELVGLAAHGEREDLVAEADAHHRDFAEEIAGLLFGAGHRGGIARAVGEHHSVRLARENFGGGGSRRHHRHAAADVHQLAEDSPLHAVVHHHHLVLLRLRRTALHSLFPAIRAAGGHFGGEILPFHAWRAAGPFDQRLRGGAGGVDDPLLRARAAEDAHQPAGVDALDAHDAVALEEIGQRFLRAPVGGLLAEAARDEARRLRALGLLVALVDAVVADFADREGDELAGVGRVGEDLLVAGVGGVEDNLAQGLALGTHGEAFEDVAGGERQRGLLRQAPSSVCTSFPAT